MNTHRFVLPTAFLFTLFFSACGGSGDTESDGNGSEGTTCAVGLTLCGETCVAIGSDGANCGACGVACEGALVCSQGTCTDTCAAGTTQCGNSCSDLLADPTNCGSCGISCGAQACVGGICEQPPAGTGGAGTGGTASGGAATGGTGTGGDSTGGQDASGGETGTGGSPPVGCEGTATTQWATDCRSTPHDCVAGTWVDGGPEPTNSDLVYQAESEHFVIYRMSHINLSASVVSDALDFLENDIWGTYFGDPMYMEEPYCDSSTKYKNVIHIRDDVGLTGGAWGNNPARMGMWVGQGALSDPWGMAHEFMHGVQSVSGGMACGDANRYCGWWYESHANWAAHQVNPNNVHCTDLFVNATHLHLGNLRNRYCNWQFAEFLKDKHCYEAVNSIWTEGQDDDPFSQIMTHMGWDVSEINDFFGEWAMHNITWDYQDPPPTAGNSKQSIFQDSYGLIDSTGGGFNNQGQTRQRITRLEALDDSWASNRRFVTNYYWAPQRWGYNVVELFPESGATDVTVTFKGVEQSGANSGWRYGLVVTDSGLTTARYGDVNVGSGTESSATMCDISTGERVWLVVLAAPTVQVKIPWDDHIYPRLYRYPWMVQVDGAWPGGFQDGTRTCAEGSPHSNGGGCVSGSANVAASAYVGPYAQVLGGTVSDSARIEDHAIVLSGSVTESATVGGLTILNDFDVSGDAIVRSTFLPIGWFGANGASGTAELLGDLEYISAKSSGSYTGFVDGGTSSMSLDEVTIAPPYSW